MKKITLLLSSLLLSGSLAWANASGGSLLAAQTVSNDETTEETAGDYYPIIYSKDHSFSRTDRSNNGVTFVSAAYGEQGINRSSGNAMYHEAIAWGEGFEAASGDEATVSFVYDGSWMHGFVYLDRGQDGQFDIPVLASYEDFFSTEDDLLAFSAAGTDANGLGKDDYYDSNGNILASANTLNVPAFNIPVLADGFYRMRFKVDWSDISPAGVAPQDDPDANWTEKNGGGFTDVRLHIHGDAVSVTTVAENGQITDLEGVALTETAPFGQAVNFMVAANKGYELVAVKARYGYKFDGEAVQYGMEQWKETELTANAEGVYTLTEEMTKANVQITAEYGKLEEPFVLPEISTPESQYWYRIVTLVTHDQNRAGKCIELLSEDSPIILQYGTKYPQADRLWSNVQAVEDEANYDYQLWALEEDPATPGKYALVNKVYPDGSVIGKATAENNTARWDYDRTAKHYNFLLGEGNVFGEVEGSFYYSIKSDQHENYMNIAAGGQGYAINLWGDPNDGNSGQWLFKLESHTITAIQQAVIPGGDAAVYTLSGVKLGKVNVKNLPAGLYIVDGKKVLVK